MSTIEKVSDYVIYTVKWEREKDYCLNSMIKVFCPMLDICSSDWRISFDKNVNVQTCKYELFVFSFLRIKCREKKIEKKVKKKNITKEIITFKLKTR